MSERLQKYLARAGVASRRKGEELITEGRVTVNGETVTELGAKVEPGDVVYLDGEPVEPESPEYHLLNKPEGFLSSVSDDRGRHTVVELVPSAARLFPVGRLDLDTTGIIILTNDGQLAHRLMHPSFEVDKVYKVEVEGVPDEGDLKRLREGILMDEGYSAAAQVEITEIIDGRSILQMTIHEGRKRQVRRMFEAVGHPVIALHRKRYAMLTDEGLASGHSRPLTGEEVKALRQMVSKGER